MMKRLPVLARQYNSNIVFLLNVSDHFFKGKLFRCCYLLNSFFLVFPIDRRMHILHNCLLEDALYILRDNPDSILVFGNRSCLPPPPPPPERARK